MTNPTFPREAILAIALLLACGGFASAEPDPAIVGKPDRIEVHPTKISLASRRAHTQFVVTGHYPGGETRDLTRAARYVSDRPEVVSVRDAAAFPAKDGEAAIAVSVGGRSATVPVTVTGQAKPDPVRFETETLAVLTKQGCNAGSCHGAPEGKGGFALSLLGYASQIDEESLIRGGLNRRVSVIEPAESLLLKKPLMRVAHVGGKKLNKSDAAYRALYDWISEGARSDARDAPHCTNIDVYPAPARVLHFPHVAQQIGVVAHFSDGSSRDITPIATYKVSHADVVSVDANGLVTGLQRGQSAVTVRYLNYVESVYFTVVQDVKGFRWSDPAENNYVDRLVHAKLKQLQYLPSDTCDDGVFVRRLYLDLTGLLPSLEQTRVFRADSSPDKRAKLVEQLLDSPEFARFWALQTADLMRITPRTLKDGRADAFARWVREAYRTNLPFDRFATQILTADGDARANPPANYFLAFKANDELTETTAQLFMGSRINCAKCHNHPFENWTQKDYYRIGAVFARVKSDGTRVVVAPSGETKHPTSGQVMKPWGVEGDAASTAERRVAFAGWLTKPGNPFFARVEVNRIWAHLLGRGIVHPVDDFRSSNPPVNGELLDALAKDFERRGYDRKHIIRTICNSRTYQRSTATNPFNETDDTLFSHALVRRLSAEQLQDAIGIVTRALRPTADLDAEAARTRKDLEAELARLAREREKWETASRAKVAALPPFGGVWHSVGPFPAANRPKADATVYPPEEKVDLTQSYEMGTLLWTKRPEWEDGRAIVLPSGNAAHYLYRKLYARQEGPAELSVVSTQFLKVWLNGRPVPREDGKTKGRRGDPFRFRVNLRPGANDLLVKVSTAGNPTLNFSLLAPGEKPARAEFPAEVAEVLVKPADGRTAADEQVLTDYLQNRTVRVRGLRRELERLGERAEYATQRPYPEQSEFLRAFGQPRRESPCSCERSDEPTIDQALQLLNGKSVSDRLTVAGKAYSALRDDALLDELYLAAFARRPTAAERQTAGKYLARGGDRGEAVRDVIWAVLNTQEFLFQH